MKFLQVITGKESLRTNLLHFLRQDDILQMMAMLKEESSQIRVLKKKIELLEGELESAKEESGVDFLTKLLSRKSLEEELSYAEEGFLDSNIGYSIVFFDIDHFKDFNDTYGHLIGDQVLKAIARRVKDSCKSGERPFRIGGEEIAIILPARSLLVARQFAEALRQRLADEGIDKPQIIDFSELHRSHAALLAKERQSGKKK